MKKLLLFCALIAVCALYSCHKKKAVVKAKIDWSDFRHAYTLFIKHGDSDSAFYYYNKVANSSNDQLQVSMAYGSMASIQTDAQDYVGAQESLVQSFKYLDEKNKLHHPSFVANYNELGFINNNLKNHRQALAYLKIAVSFIDADSGHINTFNNLALAYQGLKDYPRAIKIYQKIIAHNKDRGERYARVISNMARAQWEWHPTYNAVPELLRGLEIRKRENDLIGQSSSYEYLTDYYARLKPDSAYFYARQMYAVALKLDGADDRLMALQKLITLGPSSLTKPYFEQYLKLNDSVQTARNIAKNQFAFIRYQAEKNKADNLKLQRDNGEKKYQIAKQQLLLFAAVVFIIAGGIVSVVWYRKRRQRLEAEAQQAMQEYRLKTSKKVHDVVANGLYRVMADIEYRDEFDRDELLDQIELLYEQSRDISHDQPLPAANVSQKLAKLLTSFAGANRRVVVVGNSDAIWQNVSAAVTYEVEQVLQELMVNMKKHSQASTVAVKFERAAGQIAIRYTDDGIGLPEKINYGNGLINTGNRINAIHGDIKFDAGTGRGLQVRISFPVQ